MALLYGTDGKLWPAGALVRTLSTDADIAFEGGTLPAWLTAGTTGADASSVIAASSLTPGGVAITPATGINNTATIFGPEITLSELRRVRLDVNFTGGALLTREVSIGFQGTSSGAWILGNAGNGTPGYVFRRTSGPTDVYTDIFYSISTYVSNNQTVRLPLAITVDPPDGTIAIGEKDGVWFHTAYGSSALGTGTVTPFIRLKALDGSVLNPLHIHQVVLTREWL